MRLPGEHHDKKKCREVGGRMDTGREQRGGEVDKKKKDRSEVYQGGGKKRRRTRTLSETPKSAKTQSLTSWVARPQSRSWW